MTTKLVVPMVADREKVIIRSQPAGNLANEVVHLPIFLAILPTANRKFVRNLVRADDVKNQHIDRWIIEPLSRLSVNERITLEQRNVQILIVQRVDKRVRVQAIARVARRLDEPQAKCG